MKLRTLVAIALMVCAATIANAAPLSIDFGPAPTSPPSSQMGDRLTFKSTIRNGGTAPIEGIIAWLSLVQTDKGKEQPVDLEDWSAHKAVTVASLGPGQGVQTDWPMRLIQSGHYRVVISAVSRGAAGLTASPFADFAVCEKPVVESTRVLPVAFGLPALLTLLLLWRWQRR